MSVDGQSDTLISIVAAKHCDSGHRWNEVAEAAELDTWQAARGRYLRRDKDLYPEGRMPAPCPICTRLGVGWEEQGNYATATSTDGRVRTLEDLCAAARVDLGQWVLAENGFKVGTYEGWAKREDKDLTFERGVISGHARSKGVIIETLYRTEGRFVRRYPVPVKPMVQPVECPVSFSRSDGDCRASLAARAEGRWLLWADPHFGYSWRPPQWELVPFHDRRVLDVMLQVAEAVQPDGVDVLGDILDLTIWTERYARKPEYYLTTQPAVCEAHWWFRQLREVCPESEIRLHGGNHDDRMDRTMAAHMQDACGLRPADQVEVPAAMSVPGLLALDQLGMEWVPGYPEDICWLGQAMQTRHGAIARTKTLATVTKLLEDATVNQACGHIHRDEMASRAFVRQEGKVDFVTAYCPGCACHVDGRVPGSTSKSNWRQGLGLVEYAGSRVTITHIPVRDGTAVYGGQVFEARDRVEDLRRDLPEWKW